MDKDSNSGQGDIRLTAWSKLNAAEGSHSARGWRSLEDQLVVTRRPAAFVMTFSKGLEMFQCSLFSHQLQTLTVHFEYNQKVV